MKRNIAIFVLCIFTLLFMGGRPRYIPNSPKIDDKPVEGLEGVEDSLAYKVEEIERHVHNWEDWFGQDGTPDAEVSVADDLTTGTLAVFQIDAGNDTWGAWVQILGSGDTPNRSGNVKFDLHRVLVVDAEANSNAAFIQISAGATAAAGVSAGTYTTVGYMTATGAVQEGPIDVMLKRIDAGTKVWARCMAIGQNTMTLDFYFGIHEYEG